MDVRAWLLHLALRLLAVPWLQPTIIGSSTILIEGVEPGLLLLYLHLIYELFKEMRRINNYAEKEAAFQEPYC